MFQSLTLVTIPKAHETTWTNTQGIPMAFGLRAAAIAPRAPREDHALMSQRRSRSGPLRPPKQSAASEAPQPNRNRGLSTVGFGSLVLFPTNQSRTALQQKLLTFSTLGSLCRFFVSTYLSAQKSRFFVSRIRTPLPRAMRLRMPNL